jgi:YHS domain-containing protein
MKTLIQNIAKLALGALAAATLAGTAQAQDKTLVNVDKAGVGVKGYDVVAYFTENKPVKGSAQFTASYGGATYHFASEANKATFEKSPEKYAPQFGGYCAYGVTKNALVKIEPDAFQIVNGRLLLQYDKGIRADFSKDTTGNLTKADGNWPGLLAKKGK